MYFVFDDKKEHYTETFSIVFPCTAHCRLCYKSVLCDFYRHFLFCYRNDRSERQRFA